MAEPIPMQPKQRRQRVLIATPSASDSVPLWWAHGIGRILQKGIWVGWDSVTQKPVDLARQKLAEAAIEQDYSHILFVDTDMELPAGVLECLLHHRLPIVSALYYSRDDVPKPHAYRFHKESDSLPADESGVVRGEQYDWLPEHMRKFTWYTPIGREVTEWLRDNKAYFGERPNAWMGPRAHLIEVDAIGFGCVLIEVAALRDIRDTLHGAPMFVADYEGGGEDFYFCRAAKAAGYPIWVDLGLQCNHVTRTGVGREEFEECWDVGGENEFDWQAEGPIGFIVGPNNMRRRGVIKQEQESPSAAEVAQLGKNEARPFA